MQLATNTTGLLPTGTTQIYTFIGTPVVQVKSPVYFNQYFAQNGVDAAMIALDVAAESVPAFFEMMRGTANLCGSMVTVPHKQAAASLMDELTPRAHTLGAVNVVRREGKKLIGDNVDGQGFVIGNRGRGCQLAGKRMAVIGGGAVGRAIAYACAEEGVGEIVFFDLRAELYPELRQIILAANPQTQVGFALDSLTSFDLVVNATPVGMNDDPSLPYPTDTLAPTTFVAEVVTRPLVTPWLAAALAKGCRVQYGPDTSKGQMGMIGRYWGFDIPDPTEF